MIVLNCGLMMNHLMQEVTQNNNNNPVHKTSISIEDYKPTTFADLPFHNFA
jgi:hypothetical protein